LGYSGHFDDEVIEKVRRHPDVSSSPDYFLPFYPFCHQNRMSAYSVLLSCLSHLPTRYLCTLDSLS
jgi:hypothetical protein